MAAYTQFGYGSFPSAAQVGAVFVIITQYQSQLFAEISISAMSALIAHVIDCHAELKT